MDLLGLFIAALIPVMRLLLLTAVGSFLAIDTIDILGEDARRHLNIVVFFVFNPALVGSSLAESITYKTMLLLWYMPFNILLTYIIGSLLGWIVINVTTAPPDLRGLVLGCCASGNMGNLLLIVIPAVCKESSSPFGDADTCHTHGLTYASLSMAIGAIYLWSYVYNIVRIYSRVSLGKSMPNKESVEETHENLSRIPAQELRPLKAFSLNEDDLDQFDIESISERNSKVPMLRKIKEQLQTCTMKINLRTLFAPSTISAIVGFTIGIVPLFRNTLINDGAPLRVVQDSAALIGEAAIPTVTLILGANLLKGLKQPGMHLSLIVGIIMVRYIALPMLGIAIVKGAVRFGLLHSDPLYQFVLLLQFTLPPSMNIGTMTQLFGAGQSECSLIMLWTYALASVSLTLWSTIFMWLVV